MNKAQKEVQQSQLNDEKHVILLLRKVYERAKKDCEQKIRELSTRTDFENLQSIIYQKQYQEALKKQLEGVLEDLHSNQFTNIADYLQKSYNNGFIGTMYDLRSQGIPVIIPIRQDQVVKAVQTDSKISESLYNRLGEDTNYLKKSIRAELSRGISNGSTWNEMAVLIAEGMNSPFKRSLSNAIRIARTEGHRIQNEAALDGQKEAKKKGADIVKQWDATLDGRTRDEHRLADGQIRELDEPFDIGGEKMQAPGVGGSARNVCNCRCCLLQRAKWALDENELKTLQDRAEFYGLDKTKDFEDFREKYLKLPEDADKITSGGISGARNPYGEKAKEHARKYYGLVRSMTTDVAKISNATGMSKADVQSVKDFIFLDKHDLGNGKREYFEPDYMMAESWRRLVDGKPEKHDITLLNREIMEKQMMQQGFSQEEAHLQTSKKYDYAKESDEYYAKITKHKKG